MVIKKTAKHIAKGEYISISIPEGKVEGKKRFEPVSY